MGDESAMFMFSAMVSESSKKQYKSANREVNLLEWFLRSIHADWGMLLDDNPVDGLRW